MDFNSIITLDFETEAIDGALPPKPVGLAIKYGAQPSEYLSWGHPSGNNCSEERAKATFHSILNSGKPMLFHSASFDTAVAAYHWGMGFPKDLHDTLLFLFLHNPHAANLSLKPSAEKLLSWPPEEKDILTDWIVRNVPGATNKNAGAYISKAPASLVGPYACGDVDRTFALFVYLYEKHKGQAYDRERSLTPILVKNTLEGIRVDFNRLEKDYYYYQNVRTSAKQHVFNKLGKTFNIDSGDELADAIEQSGLPVEWQLTPTGKRSTSKPNMIKAIKDKELLDTLAYISTLNTYLDTFFTSWLNKSKDGRIHFIWNQVRNQETDAAGKFKGTRTGRLSSVPSMLNVPKAPPYFELKFLPKLPFMREYLLPDEGEEWLSRDYMSQELRLLAHYEDGVLMRAFQENPELDMHEMLREILTEVLGRPVTRKQTKNIAFSILYGSGLPLLAESLGCDTQEAGFLKRAYLEQVPGIKDVEAAIAYPWRQGLPIKTWGGREYYKEESKIVKNKKTGVPRLMDFGYKGLNYLIQGSSADVTKQAIINYDKVKKNGRFLLSVHDKICITGPRSELILLDEAMRDIAVDVPMLSDASYGPNFGDLLKVKE